MCVQAYTFISRARWLLPWCSIYLKFLWANLKCNGHKNESERKKKQRERWGESLKEKKTDIKERKKHKKQKSASKPAKRDWNVCFDGGFKSRQPEMLTKWK